MSAAPCSSSPSRPRGRQALDEAPSHTETAPSLRLRVQTWRALGYPWAGRDGAPYLLLPTWATPPAHGNTWCTSTFQSSIHAEILLSLVSSLFCPSAETYEARLARLFKSDLQSSDTADLLESVLSAAASRTQPDRRLRSRALLRWGHHHFMVVLQSYSSG